MTFTRQQAIEAAARAGTERDAIQSNLLDLENSFGKQLLAGGQALTGTSKDRWDSASVQLAMLWDTFNAYTSVIDRAQQLSAGRLGQRELGEVAELLTGRSVQVSRGPAPLARRDLADSGTDTLTLATARGRMREAFTAIADVAAAAEQAWNAVADPLDQAGRALAGAEPLGDQRLAADMSAARTELSQLRAALNADPLGARPSAARSLAATAQQLAARAATLARTRDEAGQRIAAVRASVDALRAAHAQAQAAYQQATAKISAVPPVPPLADLNARLAFVAGLLAAADWPGLAAELASLEGEAKDVMNQLTESQRTSLSLLQQRDELRGLADAYRAKAGRLGGAEDAELARLYGAARELLWTAPCDLTAAADAVNTFQRAVLAMGVR
jgi:hypothetical protein